MESIRRYFSPHNAKWDESGFTIMEKYSKIFKKDMAPEQNGYI